MACSMQRTAAKRRIHNRNKIEKVYLTTPALRGDSDDETRGGDSLFFLDRGDQKYAVTEDGLKQ